MLKSQPMVILIIIVMAIILAAGSFLALTYIQGRPEAPEGTFVTNVEGVEVTVRMDPAKLARVVSMEGVPQEPMPAESVGEQLPVETQAPAEEVVLATEEPPTPIPEPTATAVLDPVIFVPYTVQASDSLYSISERIDTSISLMAHHGISQDDLVPGTVIQLPIGNPAYCPGGRLPYAVREGDTAYSIARKFNSTADELREINGLDANYTVYTASIICVVQR